MQLEGAALDPAAPQTQLAQVNGYGIEAGSAQLLDKAGGPGGRDDVEAVRE